MTAGAPAAGGQRQEGQLEVLPWGASDFLVLALALVAAYVAIPALARRVSALLWRREVAHHPKRD